MIPTTYAVLHRSTLRGASKRQQFIRCLSNDSGNKSPQFKNNVHSNTTATSSSPSTTNYDTNSGVIEGVWVFHRHGDRTPSCPTGAEKSVSNEAQFWRTKLPSADLVEGLNEKFPVSIHPSHEPYLDGGREPFGCLTKVGCKQMQKTGSRMALRYDRHGHGHYRRAHRGGQRQLPASADNFLKDWDVSVYSTNYLRTVTSAQCFLDGLLNSTKFHSFVTPDSTRLDDNNTEPLVPVQVRDRRIDTINSFSREPKLMSELVGEVISSPSFLKYDAAAVPLAIRLARYLPGLGTNSNSSFGGPSGINWIHASDHFVCRESHDVPLSASFDEQGQQHPHINQTCEEDLRAMAQSTLSHLSWRFGEWYKSPPLLSAIAAPPLREVEKQLRNAPSLNPDEKRPFTVYSCHDVTILSLLYGIDADIIVKYNMRFWPAYATTLVFELVRTLEGRHFVRVFLNGKTVRTQGLKGRLMTLDDFSKIVEKLESMSTKKFCPIDEDSNRDMSVWTG